MINATDQYIKLNRIILKKIKSKQIKYFISGYGKLNISELKKLAKFLKTYMQIFGKQYRLIHAQKLIFKTLRIWVLLLTNIISMKLHYLIM